MAHEVAMGAPSLQLGRADVTFAVKHNGETLGALHISRGSVVWFPAGHNYGHRLAWRRLAELMVEHGERPSERR